jgi:hypothetical protein
MTAEERGVQLATIPKKDVPDLAMDFARYLCGKYGGCGEVLITAFAVYAQLAEGLTCTDSLYMADQDAKDWFAANMPAKATVVERQQAGEQR